MLRFLVATDGSEDAMRAVQQVCALSQRGLAIEAVLCNVQPPIAVQAGRSASETSQRRQREADANATMAPGIAQLAGAGVRVLTHHATGSPADEIARAARDWDADVVVVGRRGPRHGGGGKLGSVAFELTRAADLAVMVVS